jgi:ribosomal 30S subunit maturation factor RimM
MLQIFKVNNSLSKIENHRSIDVESDEFYFHMIDGTIVYVKSYDYGKDIDATVYFEDHGHFVKIQNSDAFLEMRIPFDIASSERVSLRWNSINNIYF